MDAPADESQIVTLRQFPEAGRQFRIHRTFTNSRSDYAGRRTPAGGYDEILKVVDDHGGLEFWRDGELIHSIRLGPCFSFATMDENHDFVAQGSPAYFTAPPDRRLWDGREWNQTYRTLVPGWPVPCVYEAHRRVAIIEEDGERVTRAMSDIHMTMEKNGQTYDWEKRVDYDPQLGFSRIFSVGYAGKVEVLEEITGSD